MAKVQKFTEEELKSITEIRDTNAQITSELGQIELQLFLLDEQLKEFNDYKSNLQIQFKNLQTTESELVQSLNEKYGKGTVDINTGEFVPEN